MEAASVSQPRAAEAARTQSAIKKDKGPSTPWWMWICVVAIVVFCLFPFYWLINISLKTGADLSSAAVFPPHPTLDNYSKIFHLSVVVLFLFGYTHKDDGLLHTQS